MPDTSVINQRFAVSRRDTVRLLGIAAGASAFYGARAATAQVRLRVGKNDTGNKRFDSISAALIDAATLPAPVIVEIAPGLYREKLRVAVAHVTLVAAGPGVTIANGDAAGHIAPDGRPWGTGRTATLTVDAPGVTLRGLTIRNDFDYIADSVSHASGGAQAVALSIGRAADRTLVERCAVEGFQDTLYVASRSLFRRCRIVGGVDFIFGGAAALFQGCDIVTRFVPGAAEAGFVAAPSTLAADRFGLVFDRCHLTREPGVPDRSAWLGRPWRAGGNMAILGAAAFLRCRLEAHIQPAGWTGMGFTDPAGVGRVLTPEESRLFEWRSTGPGAAGASASRKHLTDREAKAFAPDAILQGWVP